MLLWEALNLYKERVMLSAQHRLRKRKEFGYIYKKGKIAFSQSFNVLYVKSNRENFKMGFSISKKIGNAVVRNKVKRILRNIVMNNKHILQSFFNYIVVAKPGIANIAYAQLEQEFIKCVSKNTSIYNTENQYE